MSVNSVDTQTSESLSAGLGDFVEKLKLTLSEKPNEILRIDEEKAYIVNFLSDIFGDIYDTHNDVEVTETMHLDDFAEIILDSSIDAEKGAQDVFQINNYLFLYLFSCQKNLGLIEKFGDQLSSHVNVDPAVISSLNNNWDEASRLKHFSPGIEKIPNMFNCYFNNIGIHLPDDLIAELNGFVTRELSDTYNKINDYIDFISQVSGYLPDTTCSLLEKKLPQQGDYDFPVQILASLRDYKTSSLELHIDKAIRLSLVYNLNCWGIDRDNLQDLEELDQEFKDAIHSKFPFYELHNLFYYAGIEKSLITSSSLPNKDYDILKNIINARFKTSVQKRELINRFLSSYVHQQISLIQDRKKQEVIGNIVLNNFKFFVGDNQARYPQLFDHIISDTIAVGELETISLFFASNKLGQKFTDAQFVFIFENNLLDNEYIYEENYIQYLQILEEKGGSIDKLTQLNAEELVLLNNNENYFTSIMDGCDRLREHGVAGVRLVAEYHCLHTDFIEEVEYVPYSHSAYKQILDIAEIPEDSEKVCANTLQSSIDQLHIEFPGLKDMISFHKLVCQQNSVMSMELIHKIYMNFPRHEKQDKREYRGDMKAFIGFFTQLGNQELMFFHNLMQSVSLNLYRKDTPFPEVIQLLQSLKSQRLQVMLLLQINQYTHVNEIFDDLKSDASITIEKSLSKHYGEEGVLFMEMTYEDSSLVRIVSIGKLLHNGDGQKFLDYNIDADTLLSEESLISMYRIYDFFVNKYGIFDIYDQVIDIVETHENDPQQLGERIDYIYKKVWKHVDVSTIDNAEDFSESIFEYLRADAGEYLSTFFGDDEQDDDDNITINNGRYTWPALKKEELMRVLRHFGFTQVSSGGKHTSMTHFENGKKLTIGGHGDGREIPKGTMIAILKEAGITKDVFLDFINN